MGKCCISGYHFSSIRVVIACKEKAVFGRKLQEQDLIPLQLGQRCYTLLNRVEVLVLGTYEQATSL